MCSKSAWNLRHCWIHPHFQPVIHTVTDFTVWVNQFTTGYRTIRTKSLACCHYLKCDHLWPRKHTEAKKAIGQLFIATSQRSHILNCKKRIDLTSTLNHWLGFGDKWRETAWTQATDMPSALGQQPRCSPHQWELQLTIIQELTDNNLFWKSTSNFKSIHLPSTQTVMRDFYMIHRAAN